MYARPLLGGARRGYMVLEGLHGEVYRRLDGAV